MQRDLKGIPQIPAAAGAAQATDICIPVEPEFTSFEDPEQTKFFRKKFAAPATMDNETRFKHLVDELSFRYNLDFDRIKALYERVRSYGDFRKQFKTPSRIIEMHIYWRVNFVLAKFKFAGIDEVPDFTIYPVVRIEAELKKAGVNLSQVTYRNNFSKYYYSTRPGDKKRLEASQTPAPAVPDQGSSTMLIYNFLYTGTVPSEPSFIDDATLLANLAEVTNVDEQTLEPVAPIADAVESSATEQYSPSSFLDL